MTPLEWVGAGLLDFACSLAAMICALHFDIEGYWQGRHVRAGQRRERREAARGGAGSAMYLRTRKVRRRAAHGTVPNSPAPGP